MNCEVCRTPARLMWKEEAETSSDRFAIESTWNGAIGKYIIRRKFICDKCYKDNWMFTEHGVLMNETPVKKRVKK